MLDIAAQITSEFQPRHLWPLQWHNSMYIVSLYSHFYYKDMTMCISLKIITFSLEYSDTPSLFHFTLAWMGELIIDIEYNSINSD